MSHGLTNNGSMFSVREMPWHGLGVVLDEYPRSIDEAMDRAALGWKVTRGDVLVVRTPEWTDDFGSKRPAELIPAKGFKANLREDSGEVLGIVSQEYEMVDNRDAFRFLDGLIGSELHFETAGSLWGGRRVWVLARLPEYIELGGDLSATYIYVANSHDGSMAATAAATPIRIVCANTFYPDVRIKRVKSPRIVCVDDVHEWVVLTSGRAVMLPASWVLTTSTNASGCSLSGGSSCRRVARSRLRSSARTCDRSGWSTSTWRG